MTDNETPRRPARYVATDKPHIVALKIPCQGTITQHDGEQPCPVEQRFEIDLAQLEAYMAGDPLEVVWPTGTGVPPWARDPWCDDHRGDRP